MKLQDLLFKPLLIGNAENGDIILIYALEERNITALTPGFKTQSNIIKVINFIDVTKSIMNNEPIYAELPIADEAGFVSGINILYDAEDYQQEFEFLTDILTTGMSELGHRLNAYGQIFNTIRYISNNGQLESSIGNINLNYDFNNIAAIAFKSVDGSPINLKEATLEKMGEVIRDVVINNMSIDLTDSNKIDRLKAEIDFKLIECLPDNLSAKDIKINTSLIVDEIKRLKESMGNDDTDISNEEEDGI